MVSILGLLFIKSFLSGGLMSLLVSFSLFDQLVQSVSVSRLQLVLGSQVSSLLLSVIVSLLLQGGVMLDQGLSSFLFKTLDLSFEGVILADEDFLERLLLALEFLNLL